MRWGIMLTLLLSLAGCEQPVDDTPPPFLRLRHSQHSSSSQAPDGGDDEIPAQPIGDPGDPGKPVD
jgi:hypothetical protein